MQSQTETQTPILTLPEALHSEQALSLTLVEGLLSAARFRSDCPSSLTLLQHALDLMPASERPHLDLHLKTCQTCQEERTLLLELEPPQPTPLLARVLDAGRRLIQAVLEPQPLGRVPALRGASSTTRLRYQAGAHELLISIRQSHTPGAGYELEGQLEPWTQGPDTLDPTGSVRLTSDSGQRLDETIDGLGFFVLEHVPSGAYRLELLFPEEAVVVEALIVP